MQEYWYPWTPARYRADTMHLTPLEDGCYRRLIDHYMETKLPLPSNENALARVIGLPVADFRQISGTVMAFFVLGNDGLYRHKRCDLVLKEQAERSERHREKSKKGGYAKAEKHSNINDEPATGMPQPMPKPAIGQDKTGKDRKPPLNGAVYIGLRDRAAKGKTLTGSEKDYIEDYEAAAVQAGKQP